MTLNEYIQICESCGLITWNKWMENKYGEEFSDTNHKSTRMIYGRVTNANFIALVGFSKNLVLDKKGKLYSYKYNFTTTNVVKAENFIKTILKKNKENEIKQKLKSLKNDFD